MTGEKYRFTALTSWLIRMEYAENGAFVDRASQSVLYRDFPAASFARCRQTAATVDAIQEMMSLTEDGYLGDPLS